MTAKFVVVFRRTLAALLSGMLVALAIRLRGRGGVPPQSGGWRELSDDEIMLRDDKDRDDRDDMM